MPRGVEPAQAVRDQVQEAARVRSEAVAAGVLMLVQADTASVLTAGKKYLIR